MSKRTHEAPSGPMFYSIATLAERLDVSRDTVRRLIERGELVAIRIGSSVRVDAVEVEAFVRRQRRGGSSRTAAEQHNTDE
jgi:excisionase family DNA binding protein